MPSDTKLLLLMSSIDIPFVSIGYLIPRWPITIGRGTGIAPSIASDALWTWPTVGPGVRGREWERWAVKVRGSDEGRRDGRSVGFALHEELERALSICPLGAVYHKLVVRYGFSESCFSKLCAVDGVMLMFFVWKAKLTR